MATFDTTTIDKMANLAKIALTAEEKKKLALQLGSILGHIAKLQSIALPAGEPQTHLDDMDHSPLRDDQPTPSLPVKKVLQNAGKRQQGDYFTTSKIL